MLRVPQLADDLASGEIAAEALVAGGAETAADGASGAALSDGSFKAYSAGGTLFVNGGLNPGEKGEVRVINLLGQVVLRTEISGNTDQQLNCNFAAGIYLVNFSAPEGIQTKKVFIGTR